MLGKLSIVAVVGAAVIGFVWPVSRGGTSGSTENPAEVVISRSGDLHYYADAKVNGRPVHFMVDTGSSDTALTEADAKSAGIAVDPDKYEVIGEGASGIVRGQYIQLQSLDLEGLGAKDVKAVIVPGASVSLLGQNFLDKVDEIVIRRGEMRLKGAAS